MVHPTSPSKVYIQRLHTTNTKIIFVGASYRRMESKNLGLVSYYSSLNKQRKSYNQSAPTTTQPLSFKVSSFPTTVECFKFACLA